MGMYRVRQLDSVFYALRIKRWTLWATYFLNENNNWRLVGKKQRFKLQRLPLRVLELVSDFSYSM